MRTEVRRGRKFVEYIDDSLPVGTFVQEIGAHDVSYQDERGVWLPADENWSADGLDGYIVKANKLNHKVRLKGDGGRRWYPRRNVESEYLTFGIPQYWSGKRWSNFGFSGYSVDGKTITLETKQNVTILVHNRWDGIKIDWVLNNSSAPVRMRYQVGLTGITNVDGVLYGADGTELGRLTPTTATDANGNELPCSGSYSGGYVEFSADVTGAVYPVTVDPDYTADTGDSSVRGYSTTFSTARSNSYSLESSTLTYLSIGSNISGSYYSNYRSFLKFDTSGIPDTATVTQVNLNGTVRQDVSTDADFDVQIVKQDWSGQDPLSDANRETAYDNCLSGTADSAILYNTSGISVNTKYTSGNLSTSWVNITGSTYYSLRTSLDVAGTAPTAAILAQIYSADNITAGRRPILTVAYSLPAQNYTLTCDSGSYTLTGTNCTLSVTRNYVMTAAAGSYAQTGTDATLIVQRNYTLTCAAGSYALTGTNVTLTATVKQNLTLTCSAGSYSLTGTNADLTVTRHYTLACSAGSAAYPGSVTITGAGTDNANGTYLYQGALYGKSYYLKAGATPVYLYWSAEYEQWVTSYGVEAPADNIGSAITSYYYSTDAVATPDLVTTWEARQGTTPLPSVANFTASYGLIGAEAELVLTPAIKNLTLSCGAYSFAIHGTDCTLSVQRYYLLNLYHPDIVVSGAGTSAANGTYTYAFDWVGRPLYMKGGGYNIWWDESYQLWAIYLDTLGDYYTSTEAVATPELVTTWIVAANGTAPVPSVTGNSYKLTGSDATLTFQHNYTLTCSAGSYNLTGTDATFETKRNYALSCGADSYEVTGSDATFAITRVYSYTLDAGSYSLTGSDSTLTILRNYTLAIDTGSYALTGTDVTFAIQRNFTFAIDTGSYTLTGTDISFGNTKLYSLACEAGSYSLTGTEAAFVLQRNYTFACETGSYTLTGTDADLVLLRNYILACEAGGYALTGTNTGLTSARTMALESGSYALTGTDTRLLNGLSLSCEAGTYLLTGADIEMLVTYILLGSVAILPNLFALGAKGKRVSIRPTNGRIKL